MGFEITGLDELIVDLTVAADEIVDVVERVAGRAGQNVKAGAKRRVMGLRHAPSYPYSIGYDVTRDGPTVTVEVGPDKDRRQGALGNLIEFGSVNNAPIPHLQPELDIEAPRFEQALADVAVELINGRRAG